MTEQQKLAQRLGLTDDTLLYFAQQQERGIVDLEEVKFLRFSLEAKEQYKAYLSTLDTADLTTDQWIQVNRNRRAKEVESFLNAGSENRAEAARQVYNGRAAWPYSFSLERVVQYCSRG